MRTVLAAIEDRQHHFAEHPFFRRLELESDGVNAAAFVPGLTFFVLAFQDMLRLNEARVSDPLLRTFARHHRHEDKGHEAWFLNDLSKLGAERELRWIFGPEHAATRDAAYSLVSEIFRTDDDRVRLTLILVLEAAGEVFFSRVPAYLGRAGLLDGLQYFSVKHYEVERSHEIFERRMTAKLAAMELEPEALARCVALIDRGFDSMTRIMSELEGRVVQSALARSGDPHEHIVAGSPLGPR